MNRKDTLAAARHIARACIRDAHRARDTKRRHGARDFAGEYFEGIASGYSMALWVIRCWSPERDKPAIEQLHRRCTRAIDATRNALLAKAKPEVKAGPEVPK